MRAARHPAPGAANPPGPPGLSPDVRSLRALGRLLRVLLHALGGWWTVRFVFPHLTPAQRDGRVRRWSAVMLRRLGVRLQVHGAPPPGGGAVLLVCNHLSWLDILALHATLPARFVAKSDVRHWPLLGAMASGAGTLYIERERARDAMRVVHRMADALRAGETVAVFPEGTTGDGEALRPFHANLLQAAISAGVPVQPAALRFVDAQTGATSFAPRYVDDDALPASLWRTLRAAPLAAVVRLGEPQGSAGRERRAWAAQLREQVQALREANGAEHGILSS